MAHELIAPTEGHVDALVDHINRTLQADGIPMTMVRQEVVETMNGPNIDPARDIRLVMDGDRVVGYLVVRYRPSGEREERTFLEGSVDVDHRRQGIGSALFDWGIARSRERLADAGNDLPRLVRADSYPWQEDQISLQRRFGLAPVRYFHEMIRPLTDLPSPVPPAGIDILGWQPHHAEDARLTHNSAFRDHWGSVPADRETWSGWMDDYGTRTDLSVVAYEGETMVGYSLNGHYPQDSAIHGRREGWIESLGTLRSHRRRGIASALIASSFQAFAAAGLDHAMLGVDTESPTGANRLYSSLGFTLERQTIMMELDLGDR